MSDFLLELRCEEIPARMQAGARRDLEKLFREQLSAAGVVPGAITVWSTPRRLALIARDLPLATEAVSEEVKGPKTSAPEQALAGFLRKTGLTQDQLTERDGVWFAVSEKPGRATADVLAERLPLIIWQFPWPKSMRWGEKSLRTDSLRWVRPLSGIVAILGTDVLTIDFNVAHVYADGRGAIEIQQGLAGLVSGATTLGHRFHHPGEITIGGAGDYAEKLRACHVIVDHAEREAIVRTRAKAAAEAAGLVLVEDEGLVIENAGLTEWPVPLLGRFDAEFLEVPPEVIQLTARTNQKYFICRDAAGKLANAFVCTANIEAHDGGAMIVAGNRKVLAARLSDARFFWEQDRKKALAQHAEKLGNIVFHEKLGTVADKVERVAKLARWLVEEGVVTRSSPSSRDGEGDRAAGVVEGQIAQAAPPPSAPPSSADAAATSPSQVDVEDRAALANLAEQAARLCKADLVTEMVGEFPELQGLMGGYYARAEGLPDEVADAIRDHYKPVGQGDDVPTAPVTVAVSLADKLDTIGTFFGIAEKPTGSKDPFALRRACLSAIRLIQTNELRFDVAETAAGMIGLSLDQASRENRVFTYDGDEQGHQLITSQPFSKYDERNWRLSDWFVFYGRPRDPYHGSDDEMAFLESDESPEKWESFSAAKESISAFFADRLKVQQREAGVRHDLIDAVFALGGEDDLVRLLARVHALQAFVGTADGTNLLAGYKRAANILKKEGVVSGAGESGKISLSYTPEPAETALIAALDSAAPTAASAIAAEDFAGAMAALAGLREPIDAFFEHVMINDPAPEKRAARLALLDRFRAAVHNVADFSRIEG
ncbi:glycine--tRNA ligase subunit beta [Novosphingobium lentum]|uniref:glycine--tRNA ligase subunit beta n=1 Tax=Novosphingobium lentum TaxID=145287 RepID=UPI00082BE2CD|nr:glycine--tRNA ligase subunit beta [Novosphingobium lentum]